jgi:hypothetical protein
MHIYAFGSTCRGDVTPGSDVDLLAITDSYDLRFDVAVYSIYSYKRLRQIWEDGNPFAWHLHLESRLLFADNETDFLQSLGAPRPYTSVVHDCEKFQLLFRAARNAVLNGTNSIVFELSTIFLAVRNLATCFSLGVGPRPDFSRISALRLGTDSLTIGMKAFRSLERARILSTRGCGERLDRDDVDAVVETLEAIDHWMDTLSTRARAHERVQ